MVQGGKPKNGPAARFGSVREGARLAAARRGAMSGTQHSRIATSLAGDAGEFWGSLS